MFYLDINSNIFTLPKFNSKFAPEKLPKPNRKGSAEPTTIFKRQAVICVDLWDSSPSSTTCNAAAEPEK